MSEIDDKFGDQLVNQANWLIDNELGVTPIIKGSKRPSVSSWNDAWMLPEEVDREALLTGRGLGVVVKEPWVIVDIDRKEGIDGAASWKKITSHLGFKTALSTHYISSTPSGGFHVWLRMTKQQIEKIGYCDNSSFGLSQLLIEITGDDEPSLGIDIRANGGFLVCPPTQRDGAQYQWMSDTTKSLPSEAPDSFFEVLQSANDDRERVKKTFFQITRGETDPTSPAAVLRSKWDWSEELEAAGWTYGGIDNSGDPQFVRPNKHWSDGHSATLHGDGPLVVWSDHEDMRHYHAAAIRTDRGVSCLDPLGFYAAVHYAGDRSVAATNLRSKQKTNQRTNQPMETNLMDFETWAPLELDVGELTNGQGILSGGTLCGLFGHRESGKTWFSLALQAQLIREGRRVMHVDFELPSPGEYVNRMGKLGVPINALSENASFIDGNEVNPLTHQEQFEELLELRKPELVVIDSLTEIVLASEADHIQADKLWTVLNRFKVWAQKYHTCFLPIDHQARGEGGNDQGAGSRLKSSVPNGVYLRVQAVEVPTKHSVGIMDVYVTKDKTGNYASRGDSPAIRFTMKPKPSGDIDFTLSPPIEGV